MKGLDDIWKTLPVWFVIALLVIALVGTAGIWVLNIESPTKYDEPFTVKYTDELNEDEWEVVDTFPQEVQTHQKDLTYGTFHDYIKVESESRRPVQLTISFSAQTSGGLDPIHIGFLVMEGKLSPDNVTWSNNGTFAVNEEQSSKINWGFYEKTFSIEDGKTVNYTVITVLSNSAPLDIGNNDLKVNWQLGRSEIRPESDDIEEPEVLKGPSNLTPFLLLTSLMVTLLIGYSLFRKVWEEK